MSLEKVTIGITSFLRPGYLLRCLDSILKAFPEIFPLCQVADDSDNDLCSHVAGPDCIVLPFDSGLTVKRNAMVKACQTPYWFCGCDDFDFSTPGFREGLERAAKLLYTNPDIDLVGGRVNNNPYESNLEYDLGANVIREHRIVPDGSPYQKCDLVVNAFLARTSTLREVPWDEDVRPIGGEHGQFFLHMMRKGKITVWMPGLNINTLSFSAKPNDQDPRYGQFRRRAFAAGHTIMLRKEGIRDWVGA
jgi:hypothetical protein